MTTRYFEYAVSEGEGTLTQHEVIALTGRTLVARFFPAIYADESAICETISAERYAEFITIHGSEVAV